METLFSPNKCSVTHTIPAYFFFFLLFVALLMHDAILMFFFNYLFNICIPVMIMIAIFNAVLLLSRDNAKDSTHMSGTSCILILFQGQVCLTSLLLKKITSNKKWNFKKRVK